MWGHGELPSERGVSSVTYSSTGQGDARVQVQNLNAFKFSHAFV